MKQYNVILFCMLVAISLANAFEFQNLAEVQDLAKNSYANNLIQTISLKLNTNGSLDDITKLIKDLLDDLQTDEDKLDSDYKKSKKDLEDKIKEQQEKKAKYEVEKTKQEKIRDDMKELISQAEENLTQFREQKASNLKQLEENKENRKNDKKAYKESVNNHTELCGEGALFDLVIAEIEKLRGSALDKEKVEKNAAGTKGITGELAANNAILNAIQLVSKNEATLFAQLATKVDQDKLQQLIEKLTDMKKSCLSSWEEDKEKEADSLTAYQRIAKNLLEDNVTLDANIKEQEENKADYEKKLQAALDEIEKLTELIAACVKLIKQYEEELIELKAVYDRQKIVVKEDRGVVNKIKAIFEKKLQTMSEFLKGKVGA